MIYFFPEVFLEPVLGYLNEKTEKYRNYLLKTVKGEIRACTSVLTWVKFFGELNEEIGRDIALEKAKMFLFFKNLKLIELNEEILFKALKLVMQEKLTPAEAVHLASALDSRASEIITANTGLVNIYKKLLGKGKKT